MRVLVFGGSGMLGHKLVLRLRRDYDVWTTVRRGFEAAKYGFFDPEKTLAGVDVENVGDVRTALERARPDVVVNAAGVIKQLPAANDVIETLEINSIFPHRLRQLAASDGFRLISISTDCVFSGEKGNYRESDPADAVDLYGKSKNFGEVVSENCVTLRTSIIGRELRTAHGLVEWFLGNRGGRVRGFTGAVYTGFPTVIFADIMADLIGNRTGLEGLYHVSSDPIDKYELLRLINKYFDARVSIEPFGDFRIDRSLNSERYRAATGFRPPDWETMVARMAEDAAPYEEWRK